MYYLTWNGWGEYNRKILPEGVFGVELYGEYVSHTCNDPEIITKELKHYKFNGDFSHVKHIKIFDDMRLTNLIAEYFYDKEDEIFEFPKIKPIPYVFSGKSEIEI